VATSEILRAFDAAATGEPVIEGRSVLRSYRLDSGFLGFSGHFPGYPVLPGFMQLIVACGQARWCGGPVRLVTVETAKFHAQIHPGSEILVTCRCRTAERGEVLDGKIMLGETLASVFTLLVEREASGA
jgi:3-hydroxyacyl-[acyl-carrier-protein] dehydratase